MTTTLVLLPGLDGTGKLFDPFIHALPADWRVIVVSYPVDTRMGYTELASAALTALPAEGPVVLLGESFSGPIAIQVAAALGSRVQALILCCTFGRNPRPGLSWLRGLMGLLPSPATLPLSLSSRALLGAHAPPSSRALLKQALAALPGALLRARLRAVMGVNVLPQLEQLRVPVLYLQAGRDRVVPPRAAQDLQRALPTLELLRLNGPHGLLQAAPASVSAAVVSFVARHGG